MRYTISFSILVIACLSSFGQVELKLAIPFPSGIWADAEYGISESFGLNLEFNYRNYGITQIQDGYTYEVRGRRGIGISPRFYVGKDREDNKGFYLAPYYRNALTPIRSDSFPASSRSAMHYLGSRIGIKKFFGDHFFVDIALGGGWAFVNRIRRNELGEHLLRNKVEFGRSSASTLAFLSDLFNGLALNGEWEGADQVERLDIAWRFSIGYRF